MNYGSPEFVVALVAISTFGWVMTTAIRAKHGYPLEEWGKSSGREKTADAKALLAENDQLKANAGRLEERLKVLERIATDPSRQLADEIETLR